MGAEIVHLSHKPFIALCGRDARGQSTVGDPAKANCVACFRNALATPKVCAACGSPSQYILVLAPGDTRWCCCQHCESFLRGTSATHRGTAPNEVRSPEHREQSWVDGNRAAWRRLLGMSLTELRAVGDAKTPETEIASLTMQLEDIRRSLRMACEELKDREQDPTQWPDRLHLADVVGKYLMPAVHARITELENAIEHAVETLLEERQPLSFDLQGVVDLFRKVHPGAFEE